MQGRQGWLEGFGKTFMKKGWVCGTSFMTVSCHHGMEVEVWV